MITDTFDSATEEIVKVWRNENAKKVDACILTFSREILLYVLERFDCVKIGDLYSSNGANPVYGFTYEGREFAVYMSCVGAPGCVGTVPACRRKGIGLKMVQNVTAILKRESYDLSCIHYTGVAPWYGKLGYETVLRWNRNGFLNEKTGLYK